MNKTFLLISILSLWACQEHANTLSKVEGRQIQINDSIQKNQDLEEYIKPFRQRIEVEMKGKLAYAPKAMYKSDYKLNTPIGNMMADAVKEMANPIFQSRTGKNIDVVLLNYGGIRSGINAGDITTKTAYNIMPFENKVAVAAFTSDELKSLVEFLAQSKTAHPLSGLQVTLDAEGNLKAFNVNGEPIQQKIYHVATSDYLVKGGDSMDFFLSADSVDMLDYKLRDLFIDYFKKKDTLAPVHDKRFYKLNIQ
jgi:2',3'-cyclic-nucleotide 2'-phosphodiesterase (5'-nucleotidase family)